MSRFTDIKYDAGAKTVTVGSGLIWDEVYAALVPLGVNVVGGRVSGVGVSGLLLGGGLVFCCLMFPSLITYYNRIWMEHESVWIGG
jgi:hypothetical protein